MTDAVTWTTRRHVFWRTTFELGFQLWEPPTRHISSLASSLCLLSSPTTMADPHDPLNPASPISSLLRTLGLTREDLVLHTEQMRAYLSQGSSSQPTIPTSSGSRTLRRSHTISFSSTHKRNPSPTPPRTPVKSEPVEPSLSSRPMDTMEMVMERKSRQAKRERRGS